MKILIPLFLILFFSCGDKDNDSDSIFDYTLHKNNRVASLKMSEIMTLGLMKMVLLIQKAE